MKAFSFSSILKNFGKQLSSLASQMPWCNLRFNLGSMSVLSRVSGPFSRTSLSASSGTSFGTSRRASHFAAMIFAVLTLSIANIGMAWGATTAPTGGPHTPGTTSTVTANGRNYEVFFSNNASRSSLLVGSNTSATTQATSTSGWCNIGSSCGNNNNNISTAFTLEEFVSNVKTSNNKAIRVQSTASSERNIVMVISGYDSIAVFGKSNDISVYAEIWNGSSYGASSALTLVGSKNQSSHYKRRFALDKTKQYRLTLAYGTSGSTNKDLVAFSLCCPAASCTNPTASWSTAPANGTAGGNMNASLTTNYAAGVVYTSSNTDVATVSGNGTTTCAITYVAAGTARITATVTGDGSTICAGPATCYTDITVSAPEPECGSTAQTLSLSSNSGTICGTGTATFTVSGGSGTGELSVTSSDPTKATASIDGSTVTVTGVAAGNATITVTKACDATYAEATATYSVTVAAIPTANAGADKTTEPDNDVALAATAAASGCTGAWTIQSGPNISTAQLSSTSSATAIFTPTVAGTYTLRWTVTNTSSSCSAYDEMTVSAVVCSISECGNATITYAINGGSSGDHATGGTDLISSATANNTTALGASTTVGYTGISMSSLAKKAAAAISACYPTKPNMSGKIGVYNGAACNSSNYLQFAFTVKTGYTFTPCDIEFTVQPVDVATNFRWEVTDGTNVYGYGTATDVPKGSDGGASVLTGLTSTAEMAAGTYYIRLYPYVNAASKTFRISNNVILKGTTAAAACTAPTNVTIDGAWDKFGGETISLTATATGGSGNYTYQWQKKIGENWENITDNATATTANLVYENCDGSHSGTYRCVVSTGADCSTASNGLQVKVYTLECYNNGTNIYHFTRNGNTQSGTLTLNLNANTAYEFKVHVDNDYYGNGGTINKDETNWVLGAELGTPNLTVNSGLGGTFTFTIDYSTGGNNNTLGVPEISVTYPRKTIYLNPGVWDTDGAKYAIYYFIDGHDAWSNLLVGDACGTYTTIPQWNGVTMIAVRLNSDATGGTWDDKWNQTGNIAVTNNDYIEITGWGENDYTYSTYTPATYSITFEGNGNTGGSMTNVTGITCGEDRTLAANTFTRTGYTFAGWATTADGAVAHTDKATISNITSNITLYAKWTEAASLTALECNTLYKVADMVPASITLSETGQYGAGLSANTKFEVLGDPSKTGQAAGTPEMKNEAAEFASQSFTARMYLKGASNTTGSGTTFVPTSRAVKFIVGESGTLDIYAHRVDRLYLKKAGDSGTTQLGNSTSGSGSKVSHNVTAGTYYIYATNSNTCIYGIQLNCCTTPDAPTGFTAGSITSTGATFTITDAGDAASYDIYYSTSSTAPAAGTAATTTSDSKTKSITGLTASTTYYAWVRSVCDADHKSAWVALGTTSFTTAAAPVGGCEDLVNTSAKTSTELNTTVGEATLSNPGTGNSSAIKLNSSGYIELSPKAGYSFEEGDKILVTIYNQASGEKTTGFKIGDQTFTAAINGKSNYTFEETLTAANIVDGKVKIMRHSSDGWFVSIIIQRCAQLPSCTTPVLEDLSAQTKCPGEDVTWTANNTEALQDGETIAYQWNKKGNNTVLSSNATLTLTGITEATGGTYVVTATVSADGKASKTASKEVTLTVTPATATPTITANAPTIYTGNDVTLTASCASNEVTYQWYTCTDAEGTNAQAIGGATNATYTLTAGEAGTYYYKVIVTGDGTHSCGTAEEVYTLVVSASNSGETTCGEITGQFTSGAYTFDTDFIIYGINSGGNLDAGASSTQGNNRCGGSGSFFGKQRFVVTFPVDVLSFSFIGYQSNLRTVEAVKTTTELKTTNTEYTNITHTAEASQEGNCQTHVITPETAIPANTFVWVELNNGLNISEICYVPVSTADCTDPQVTATVDNATICAGTESTVTFTATNYADGAEFQWQKKNGNTWENISGATNATYTINPVAAENTGKYRVIAEAGCKRTSEEVTLTVLTAPTFNTFATTASVMKGNALTINDVEATNATEYTWYKSADELLDVAADTKVGTTKELLLAASSITEEADQAFYLFCVASNSCGSVTSNYITVTVTPFVEEECATKGNEGEHDFSFENTSCSSITYESKSAWETNSSKEYLTYTAPEGRYFATAKVTVAHTNNSKAVYGYSTDGGTTWTYVETSSAVPTAYTTITIELPADVNAFRIGRNMDGKGTGTGKFYLAEACFTYENACTPTSVTPTTASFEYNMSVQMDFVEPTFTVKHGEEVDNDAVLTYTSSNPAIATVDEDGSVTFEGMTGTVTITAAYAGTTIDEIEYCASEGSYTITVGCQDQEPKIIAAAGTNLDGCNNSITLEAKMQDGTTAFTGGTYQWYRDGEAIEGATSASYEVVRAGTYTVSRTYTCTTMSSNSAVVTNENPEPKVERLTPFQYYHVDKTYSNQMKDRHLFAVTSYGTSDGKRYHLTATRNGETLDLSSSTAFFTIPSSDNAVDTVMINLNELKGKYSANDEIVITCAPINNCNQVSAITSSITIHVIDQTPTLALICSGSSKAGGTRKTSELTVGGDFLTGYNVADLCQQTGNTSFDANTEWGFYTELKTKYIVTPVNGYAEFNKLNYEPFDILLLTDYPKASKSEAAATILDDMAALCDYRPLLSLKAHMVAKSPSKWAAKGFTTSPVVPAATSQYANIVCYAHPMFDELDDAQVEGIYHDHDDFNQLVYQILTGPGHEGGKGLQGFELKDADNFVTIGLIHYNAAAEVVTHTDGDDTHTHLEWTPAANDRQLVAIAERQANIEARMILFAINCGAQSMQTPMGRQVLLTCLDYLLKTDPIEVADCRLTFDNGEGNTNWGQSAYEGTGTKGDGLWSTAANWGPEYKVVPGRNNDVRIAAPCTVDANNVEVLSVHITEDGSLTIPADKSLTARSTILRADEHGNVYPTNVEDISLGSNAGGNASLILNNERGDTKAGVAMYSTADADTEGYSAAESTWQYIGTPHSDVQNAANNYYDSWLYQYDTETQGWAVIPNGGPLVPFRGYCVTHPESPHTYWMEGTLVSTTNQDISIPANRFVVVANSWTAPIQINELTDDDMEGLTDKTIYFFNTGSDPNQEGELDKENGRYAAGTYVSVPIHSAPYTGDSYIPSMQGFYVVGGGADGTLHLDYERHVRAKRENVPSGPMHAPARRVVADDEPQVAKFLFRGTRYDDRLIILERPDFTRGYDSGWDGEQWGGNAAAPMSYVVTETRWDAVSAIPEYEGTVIAFRAGEDSEYTIHFDYDGMEDALYLLDTDTQIYTRVLKGNSYTFTCTDKAEHNRFILTRKAPQIATATENINTGENAKAVKFIKDDKIFIFVNGMLYDATGKMVIR